MWHAKGWVASLPQLSWFSQGQSRARLGERAHNHQRSKIALFYYVRIICKQTTRSENSRFWLPRALRSLVETVPSPGGRSTYVRVCNLCNLLIPWLLASLIQPHAPPCLKSWLPASLVQEEASAWGRHKPLTQSPSYSSAKNQRRLATQLGKNAYRR